MAELELDIKLTGLEKAAKQINDKLAKPMAGIAKIDFGLGKGGGGKDDSGGALSALVGLGTKAVAALAVVSVVVGALKDLLSPILDRISLMVQLVMLPFAMLLQGIMRVALVYTVLIFKALNPAIKSIVKFFTDGATVLGKTLGTAIADAIKRLIPGATTTPSGGAGGAGTGGAGGAGGAATVTQVMNPVVEGMGDFGKKIGDWLKGFDFTTFSKAVVDGFLGLLLGLVMAIGGAFRLIFNVGVGLIALLGNVLRMLFEGGVNLLKAIGDIIGTLFVQNVLNPIIGIFTWLLEFGALIAEILMVGNKMVCGWISDLFAAAMKTIDDVKKILLDGIMGAVKGLVSAIQGAIDSAKAFLKSVGDFAGGVVGGVKGALGVHDAIITPNGQVIQTDPADYLIATKNPGALGGSGTVNITINNPRFDSDADMRRMLELMKRELAMDLKRGGAYGSGQ